MKPLVVLRAASGERVGAGHVRRSRALAAPLAALGARVLFVVDDARSAGDLAAEGFAVELAGDGAGWTERGAVAAWIDGQGDFSPELLRLRRAGTRTLLVENRTQARHFAERVVYPALHWRADAWDRAHPERVLGGPRWIPLAAEVEATRALASAERDVDLLVSFGGSDPNRLTERVLGLLEPARTGRLVVSVGWHMAERRGHLVGLAERFERALVLEPGRDLAPWMARSRRALTALGTTLYELAFLGTPAWILANWAEDRGPLEHYAASGPHRPLGIAAELDDRALADGLRALERGAPCASLEAGALGGGAARLARLLLAGDEALAGAEGAA